MRRWISITLLFGGLVAGTLLLAGHTAAFPPPPPGGPGGRGPKHGPTHDLRKAYDRMNEAALYLEHGGRQVPPDVRELFEKARQVYRTAYDAAQDDVGSGTRELAVAAHDAGRGLIHYLRATTPPVTDLPSPIYDGPIQPPPPGADRRPPPPSRYAGDSDPSALANDELQRAYDRITNIDSFSDSGFGREFLTSSRQAYRLGREAFLGNDYAKAAELARAAEAWSHVGEHLARADGQQLAERDRRSPRELGSRDQPPRDEPPPPPDGRRPLRGRFGAPPPLD